MPPLTLTPEMQAMQNLVAECNLQHIAIIMDGNRRWAELNHKPKLFGHRQGVKALKSVMRHADDIGVKALTVYAFSTENWQRAQEEVGYLMDLFAEALLGELEGMAENNVRIKMIGDLSALNPKLQKLIRESEERLSKNTGLLFQVAMNYGSRAELIHVMRTIGTEIQQGQLAPENIDEALVDSRLYTSHTPSLDLLIRTGGESRLSNYLLWQAAYAEFYVSETLWPDFSPAALDEAIQVFANRQRRFGK